MQKVKIAVIPVIRRWAAKHKTLVGFSVGAQIQGAIVEGDLIL